jgi:hypothetical protein
MITTRKNYENNQKNYFNSLIGTFGEVPSNHKKAIELRMNFFKKYVLNRVCILSYLYYI